MILFLYVVLPLLVMVGLAVFAWILLVKRKNRVE